MPRLSREALTRSPHWTVGQAIAWIAFHDHNAALPSVGEPVELALLAALDDIAAGKAPSDDPAWKRARFEQIVAKFLDRAGQVIADLHIGLRQMVRDEIGRREKVRDAEQRLLGKLLDGSVRAFGRLEPVTFEQTAADVIEIPAHEFTGEVTLRSPLLKPSEQWLLTRPHQDATPIASGKSYRSVFLYGAEVKQHFPLPNIGQRKAKKAISTHVIIKEMTKEAERAKAEGRSFDRDKVAVPWAMQTLECSRDAARKAFGELPDEYRKRGRRKLVRSAKPPEL